MRFSGYAAAGVLVMILAVVVGLVPTGPAEGLTTRAYGQDEEKAAKTSEAKSETEAAKADAPKSDTDKPDAAKPDAAKPDAAKPDAAKPDSDKPSAKSSDAEGGKAAAEAKRILKASREKLLQLRSLKAKIVEHIAISDRRFKAEGTYLQGTDLRLKLELRVKAGSIEGTILEVCDGGVLTSQYTVGDTPRVTRRNVTEILAAVKNAPATTQSQLIAELGLGGLPSLLASVEQMMSFTKVREETIEGQTFTVLEGGWGKEFMDQWKAVNKKAERLPEHIPDGVRIYFDGKTLLPRRFVYQKQATDKGPVRPMVTLDFQDLVINAPISDDEFDIAVPDDVPQEDITKMFLDRLRGSATRGEGAGRSSPPGSAKPGTEKGEKQGQEK